MSNSALSIRIGSVADAETISALAIQVFLDTYATEGVSPGLAKEAFAEYGQAIFAQRLGQEGRSFYLAERNAALLGFAEVQQDHTESPIPGVGGSQLVRLYVQPQAQRSGIGRTLLQATERCALDARTAGVWLSAWEHNARALAFYSRQHYEDVGHAQYVIQGQSFGNRVLFRPVVSGDA